MSAMTRIKWILLSVNFFVLILKTKFRILVLALISMFALLLLPECHARNYIYLPQAS